MKDIRSFKNLNCFNCNDSLCGYYYRQMVITSDMFAQNLVGGGGAFEDIDLEMLTWWFYLQSFFCTKSLQLPFGKKFNLSRQDLQALEHLSNNQVLPPFFDLEELDYWRSRYG
eukprot:TRINITY_DN2831_c0_g1_i1.p1 TRINITY_DN2831_c0_g1~~TRINITY_DN2831_c0_g1_i1.p1  ORF type:complete len:113 (+),score=32.69 TRINITY_DN2831_c0_g1_i1:178-516(+)